MVHKCQLIHCNKRTTLEVDNNNGEVYDVRGQGVYGKSFSFYLILLKFKVAL
jgi:hypothetical protein